ncbi:MAG: ABC transporter substrate-binding protein [Rhodospirillales bacterium]
MMIRRTFLAAFLGLTLIAALTAAGPAFAATSVEDGAKKFINELSDQALKSLTTKGVPRSERIERFRTLFNDNFAVTTIGQWILGRYWRKATDEQQKEYLKLFEDLIVVSYVDRFAQYTGEGLTINKTLANNDRMATVFSEITQPGNTTPVRVDWRVGKNSDKYKIFDVVVEGTSMSQTMRSDFGSIIRQKGGEISGLIEVLREKTASLKKEIDR